VFATLQLFYRSVLKSFSGIFCGLLQTLRSLLQRVGIEFLQATDKVIGNPRAILLYSSALQVVMYDVLALWVITTFLTTRL